MSCTRFLPVHMQVAHYTRFKISIDFRRLLRFPPTKFTKMIVYSLFAIF